MPWGKEKGFSAAESDVRSAAISREIGRETFRGGDKGARYRAARDEQIEFSFLLVIAFCSFVCPFFMGGVVLIYDRETE